MTEKRRARLHGLPGWRWEPLARSRRKLQADVIKWEATYIALHEFLRDNGGRYPAERAGASKTPIEERWGLANWVTVQRRAHTKNTMAEGRAARPHSLTGWLWSSDARQRWEAAWDGWYRELQTFLRQSDGRYPNRRTKVASERSIAAWVHNQRVADEKTSMAEERAARLGTNPQDSNRDYAQRGVSNGLGFIQV